MDKKTSAYNVDPNKQTEHPSRPSPADFDNFLPWACAQLQVDADIIITRSIQSHYVSAKSSHHSKSKERTKPKPPPYNNYTSTDSDSGSYSNISHEKIVGSNFVRMMEEKLVHIETVYDKDLNLVQLKFHKNTKIPRLVMKIIALIIPYYMLLSSVIIDSGLHAEAIYEISKFLPKSRITELCLDYTNIAEANYHIVLKSNVLKHLSLSKCNINDAVVKTIASELAYACPASKTLSALNLSTNRITDVGVKYLAEILRSNRRLSYLNLADNMITDEGAISIFDILTEFALTKQETIDRSNRLINHLKEKQQLALRMIKKLEIVEFDKKGTRKKLAKSIPVSIKKKTEETSENRSTTNIEISNYERAEMIAEDILGPFIDPFGPENTVRKESIVYCFGNNILSYLNLAYNNLTHISVEKLCGVLKSQKILGRKPKGLINIRIEGNYMPKYCDEFKMIDDLLMPGLVMYRKHSDVSRKKSPVMTKNSSKRFS